MRVLLVDLFIICVLRLFPCQSIFGFLSFISLILLKFSHASISILCVYLPHHFLVFVQIRYIGDENILSQELFHIQSGPDPDTAVGTTFKRGPVLDHIVAPRSEQRVKLVVFAEWLQFVPISTFINCLNKITAEITYERIEINLSAPHWLCSAVDASDLREAFDVTGIIQPFPTFLLFHLVSNAYDVYPPKAANGRAGFDELLKVAHHIQRNMRIAHPD